MYSYAGNILWVDLSKKHIRKETLKPSFAKAYLGGRGFNARRLWDLIKSGTDPLSPDNVLCVGPGTLTGTVVGTGTGRFNVSAKSPLTDIFGDGNAGGFFAPELKFAGYDQVVVLGRAEKPTYLWIEDDRVELRDASKLWGMTTWDTQKTIREELGDEGVQAACIGPAGENLVRFANVINGLKRANGRTGTGAVMGSKKLKAVAVRGTKGLKIADPDALFEVSHETYEMLRENPVVRDRMSVYGTPGILEFLNEYYSLCTRNYERPNCEFAEEIGGVALKEKYSVKMRACFGCPWHCTHHYMVRDGKWAGTYGDGPEFNVTGMLGAKCGCSDLAGLLKMDQILNQYGMDNKSCASMIAWAMDCYNRGIISEKDTDGLELNWGDSEVMVKLIQKIANKDGFGKILAEGEKRAPEIVGRGSEKYMYHIKGLATLSEEPRTLKGFCLGWVISTRGADHLRAENGVDSGGNINLALEMFGMKESADPLSPLGKGRVVSFTENLSATTDCTGICKWFIMYYIDLRKSPDQHAKLISAATGWKLTGKELVKIGERIINLEKAFNSREGMTRKDDRLPDRFTKEPLVEGPGKGSVVELDIMLDEYYDYKGWDKATGLQKRAKLEELGLKDVADGLEATKKLGG